MDSYYYHEKMAKERQREIQNALVKSHRNTYQPIKRKLASHPMVRITVGLILLSALAIYLM